MLAEIESIANSGRTAAREVRTILFTDNEASTALSEQFGDDIFQEIRHAHNDIVRSALLTNDGSAIKHTGMA